MRALTAKRYVICVFFILLSTVTIKTNCQNNKIDSLNTIINSSKKTTQKILAHLKLSDLKAHSNSKEAINHINQAEILSKTINNDTLFFEVYSKYANYYFIKQDTDNTLFFINKALAFKDLVSPQKLIKIHRILAQTSNFIGDYNQAIKSYSTALTICNEHDLINSKVGILNGLGSIYLLKEDYSKAETYIKQSIALCKENNLNKNLMHSSMYLGHIYIKQNKNDAALKIYKTIEANLKINKDIILQHSVNTALGRWYKQNKDYKKAIFYFKENLKIDESIHNEIGVNTNRSDIAFVLIQQKKYNDAIQILKNNLSHAKTTQNPTLIKQNHLNLAELYEITKTYDKALLNRKAYEKWNDSIVSDNNKKVIRELEIKYQTEKKEKDILALSSIKLKNEAALEKQQTRIKNLSFSLLGLALLFGLAFVIFRQRANNKKQQELIAAIADTQIEERKRIAQDLHDGVGGSLALAKNKLEMLLASEKEKTKEVTEFLETLSHTSNQIRQISHNMMPGELVKFGLVSAIQSTLDQLNNNNLKAHLYTHGLDKRIDQTKEIHTFRIIQEIIQNVIKHAKANTLNIHLNKYAKKLSLLIEDDGVGFEYKGYIDGIGLKNIKNRVHYLKGKLHIDSNKGKGTTFNIEIPLI